MPPNVIFNTVADLASGTYTIPANTLLTVTDSGGNIVCHSQASVVYDRSLNSDALNAKFIVNVSAPYNFPLTFSVAADPNAQVPSDGGNF